jgi:hypothetical protein
MSTMDGVEVKIGRRSFVVPPITMWLAERLGSPEAYANPRAMGTLIQELLSENYPDLTVDDVMKVCPATKLRLEATLKAVVAAAMADTEPSKGEAGSP